MNLFRNIFIGALIIFILVSFVFKPFGKFSYPIMALFFLSIVIGLIVLVWIFVKD